MLDGKRRDMGLGSARGPGAVSLADAREKAAEAHKLVRGGLDPLRRRDEQAAAAAAAAQTATAQVTKLKRRLPAAPILLRRALQYSSAIDTPDRQPRARRASSPRLRVRRLLVCPCHGPGEPKSFAALDLGGDAVAPELAYVTARYAALVPFGKVAALLSELLPVDGARHAGTVRNRTLRVGEAIVQPYSTEIAEQPAAPAAGSVVVGLDGGYVRSRHRCEERHFEVIAGKVIDAEGVQHRFAFTRNGQAASAEAFREALAAAGVGANTPSTVLADGDAGLWRLQREVLPGATPVLDWWHAAVRFEHALQTARGLGAGTANACLIGGAVHNIERAKWRLWHGRWPGCRRKLVDLLRWTERRQVCDLAGVGRLQRHVAELLGYLERNQDALVPYAARRRRGEPICTRRGRPT